MSKTPEQRSWENFKTAVNTGTLKLERIENIVSDGTPDVISQNRRGTVFWVENKALDEWPKRPTTRPLQNKFEPGQMPFLRNWIQWNGRAFVLLRADGLHYLLNPLLALRDMTRFELVETAIAIGKADIVRYFEEL